MTDEPGRLDPAKEIVVDKNAVAVSFLEPSPDEMPAIDHSLMNDVSIGESPMIPIEKNPIT